MARAVSFTQASGKLTIQNARVVFEPSAYDDSDCPRKNSMLEDDDIAKDTLREREADLDANKLASARSQYGCLATCRRAQCESEIAASPNGATNNPHPTRERYRAALRRLAYEEAVNDVHATHGTRIRRRTGRQVPVSRPT